MGNGNRFFHRALAVGQCEVSRQFSFGVIRTLVLLAVTDCEKVLVPWCGRLSAQIKNTALALGVSRPWLVAIDFFTWHWQLASVSGIVAVARFYCKEGCVGTNSAFSAVFIQPSFSMRAKDYYWRT